MPSLQGQAVVLAVLLILYNCVSSSHGLTTPSASTATRNTVVYGPQSRELLLLVSKLAAQQGIQTSCICAPGTEVGCRRLMYGKDYAAAGIDEGTNAKPISDSNDMSTALGEADSMVLIGYDQAVEGSTLKTFLKYTNKDTLKRIVLISKIGVTSTRGGFFGGGGNKELLTSEQELVELAAANNLQFSIVRAGILKGGGPGLDADGNPIQEVGLNKAYYNTILDIVDYKVCMAHDKFSLGADTTSVLPGDPHILPNKMTQIGTRTSFDPTPTDTNRIVVAAAALQLVDPIEFSVGTAAGQALPTPEKWNELFQSLSKRTSAVA